MKPLSFFVLPNNPCAIFKQMAAIRKKNKLYVSFCKAHLIIDQNDPPKIERSAPLAIYSILKINGNL